MADVDKEILKELTAAKRAPRNFAFVNASGGGGLLMSKKKLAGTAVKEKQKECGGGLVIRGRCRKDDDGKLLFETMANVSDGLSKKLRETIKEASGLTIKAEFRHVDSVEEIDEEEQDETQASEPGEDIESTVEPTPDEGGTRFAERLKALMPRIKQGSPGSSADVIKRMVGEVQAAAREKDFTRAEARLDELETLLASAPTEGTPAGRTVDIWRDAKEQVNGRISALQNTLRKQPDPDYGAIADKGLNGITKRLQVGLQVILMEFDGGEGDAREKARTKARAAVADFEKFLASDEMVGLVDDNPFGVAVGLRSTLGAALSQLSRALNS